MILARYSQRFTKLILLKRSIKHRYFDYLSNYNTLDLFECLYKNFEVNYWEKSKRSLAAWLCGRQPIHFAASKPFLLQQKSIFNSVVDATALQSFSGNVLPKRHGKKWF